MKRTIKLTGHDQRNYAFDSIEKAIAEGKLHRVIIEPVTNQRTAQQNNSLWLWAEWLAEWFNDNGYLFKFKIKGLKKELERFWNKEMIVDYLVRPFVKAEAGHDSTSKATTAELSRAIENLQNGLAESIGVNIPFPSRFDLMNGVRK